MTTVSSTKTSDAAFTLTELIVVVACLALLAILVLPALAGGANQSARAGCLANLRRLQMAAEMYRVENNDYLMPNGPGGCGPGWVGGLLENWGTSDANTNLAAYASTLIGAYLSNNLSVLRCPADVVPSANGTRIRSYSMNGQMAGTALFGFCQYPNTSYRFYVKGSDLICPTPANAFVFLDESPFSIGSSWFELSLSVPQYPDVPASYLDGGCGFSFADGHGEIHKWLWSTANPNAGIRNVPCVYGRTGSMWQSSGLDVDWIWLRDHAACRK